MAVFRANYASFLSTLPNPEHITSDTFSYTLEELVMGAGNSFESVQSTASVTVSMDIVDYGGLVDSIEGYRALNISGMVSRGAPLTSIVDVYGESLKQVAIAKGWHDGFTLYYHNSLRRWSSWSTDWWYFDPSDVEDELNSIGYSDQSGGW